MATCCRMSEAAAADSRKLLRVVVRCYCTQAYRAMFHEAENINTSPRSEFPRKRPASSGLQPPLKKSDRKLYAMIFTNNRFRNNGCYCWQLFRHVFVYRTALSDIRITAFIFSADKQNAASMLSPKIETRHNTFTGSTVQSCA
jgi:hypothetical protein